MISDALAHLSQDHVSFRKLLNILEREVDAIGQCRDPDFDLLTGILSYFGEYSGRFHHPVEHLIYAALEDRLPAVAPGIEFIERQHQEIAKELENFSTAVENVRADVEVLRHAFCDAARRFIAFERRHIRGEETSLFYLAVARLGPADWLAIDQEARRILAPLSEVELAERFRKLYADVTAWDFDNNRSAMRAEGTH